MSWRALFGAMALLLSQGCAGYQISVSPPPGPPAPRERAPLPVSLVVEPAEVVVGSGRGDATNEFANRIVMELRRARGFENVFLPRAAGRASADAVRLAVLFDQHTDHQVAANVGKAVLVAFTFLLAAPLVEFEMGYHARFRAIAATCDEWGRGFESVAHGELRYGFGANETLVQGEFLERVIERALTQLADALAADPALRERVESLVREGDCNPRVIEE